MYSVVLMMALSSGAEVPDCHRSNGCYGGAACYGGGACYGCYGTVSHGCRGGGLLGRRGGCHGCYGGCQGVVIYSCHGCMGGVPMYGCVGGMPPDKMPPKDKDKKDKKDKVTPPDGEVSYPAPATIVVSLPADAKLTIDDNPTTSTTATRVFQSPSLAPGKDFRYTLKAEVIRDGKAVVETQEIIVRAGATTRVTLDPEPAVSVAQK
jgi:uncharacterized protein (TIGR03000 family)